MPPKQKDKDDQASLRMLKADLKEKTVRNLYVFHGEEVYLRDYYLDRLRELLLEPGMETFKCSSPEI